VTIAVLGGTGLVGRYVVETLANAGMGQIVATHRERRPYQAAHTRWLQCDLRRPEDAKLALAGADVAIVCAGRVSTSAVLVRDPVSSIVDTLRVVTNVLEAAAKARVDRVVMISSCTAYPMLSRAAVEDDLMVEDPPGQWFGVGWMHRYAEQQLRWYVERLGMIRAGVALRPTLIYGRYDDFSPESGHFVPSLVAKVVDRTKPLEIWGDGQQSRNLVHGSDVGKAVLSVLPAKLQGAMAFNVASPTETTINEVVQHLLEIDGYVDAEIHRDFGRATGSKSLAVSGAALRETTGWEPTMDLRSGLADTVAWYRQCRRC
jgi:GDP-L-fucose synthase